MGDDYDEAATPLIYSANGTIRARVSDVKLSAKEIKALTHAPICAPSGSTASKPLKRKADVEIANEESKRRKAIRKDLAKLDAQRPRQVSRTAAKAASSVIDDSDDSDDEQLSLDCPEASDIRISAQHHRPYQLQNHPTHSTATIDTADSSNELDNAVHEGPPNDSETGGRTSDLEGYQNALSRHPQVSHHSEHVPSFDARDVSLHLLLHHQSGFVYELICL